MAQRIPEIQRLSSVPGARIDERSRHGRSEGEHGDKHGGEERATAGESASTADYDGETPVVMTAREGPLAAARTDEVSEVNMREEPDD